MNILLFKQDLFQQIAPFLSHQNLLNMMLINHQIQENVQKYIKNHLHNLGLIQGNPVLPPHIIYKTIYSRESYYWSKDDQVKPFKRKHTIGIDVKEARVGLTFSAILSYSNVLYFAQTNTFLENGQPNYTVRKNIKNFSVLARGLILYLDFNGNLFITFENQQELLLFQKVDLFESSYYLCILFFIQPTQTQYFENIEVQGLQIQLHDLTLENLQNQQRYKRILGLEQEQIYQVAPSINQFYVLTKSRLIYASDITQKIDQIVQQNYVTATRVPFFDKRYIINIKSGLNQFLALGREEISELKQWNNEQVVEWLGKQGFGDYQKIVQYNDYDGEQFSQLALDKNFQKETLGMKNEDLSIKMITEVTRANIKSYKDYELYAWGKNDLGQLPCPISNKVSYQRVYLPNLQDDEDIVQMECGWKESLLLTSKGRIFKTEYPKPQKKDSFDKDEEDNKQQKQQQQQQQQQQRKKSKQIGEQQQNENKYWLDVSKVFIKPGDKRLYKNYYINSSKSYIMCVCCIFDRKQANTYFQYDFDKEAEKGNKKLKVAEQILHRIVWDPQLDKSEYIVGYDDRFLGIMEISVDDFLVSQVKTHRIQYFKKSNNKIMWDRAKRIDLF